MEERKTQRKTKAELKEMIINLKVQNIALQVPYGHCPYAYFSVKNPPNIECGTASCGECKHQFLELKRQDIAEQVKRY